MDTCKNLLKLPDLALYNICTFISCPFDLLSFGNTCSHLRKISMSQSLWWSLSFRWCRGLWSQMEDVPQHKNPRDWLLEVLKQYSIPVSGTKTVVNFKDGETWERTESKKFRCIFGMLRLAYKREKNDHPAVLYEQWLYDIGLFIRAQTNINYMTEHFYFTDDSIEQLSSLGQALERDLRRRKQPYIDPKYYVKRVATTEENWKGLFPSGPHGSICPLLMCPFQDAFTNEVSGLPGLTICFSIIVEEHIRNLYKLIPLHTVAHVIKTICKEFINEITLVLPEMEAKLGPHCLRSAIFALASEGTFNHTRFRKTFDSFNIPFNSRAMISDFSTLLMKYDGIDMIVDEMRMVWRSKMLYEITNVLQVSEDEEVARVNLTDSDLIGGDNSRQEMSAAAFISKSGVLVTWHLTGRMRY